MKGCAACGREDLVLSRAVPFCPDCIRTGSEEVRQGLRPLQAASRRRFDLPESPAESEGGRLCTFCVNRCAMAPGEIGFCGMRSNRGGKLHHHGGTAARGFVQWYHDPLPTNCVGDWVCAGGSESGYPEHSHAPGPEVGYDNLAVFYRACTFNCAFCQNWHFKEHAVSGRHRSADELAEAVDERTSCICYFGGDPTPQLPHAIKASRIALRRAGGRILRICFETNGSMSRPLLAKMLELCLESGGCIKLDLKAFDERLHRALCGVSNQQTLDNFRWLAQLVKERRDPPLLIASTLMVPGHVEADEVAKIAGFIASLDASIPYALLAFGPAFLMHDLRTTPKRQAEECLDAATGAGLTRVRVGNQHLLS
jgi:pyruvate formate lyase activating enzyme